MHIYVSHELTYYKPKPIPHASASLGNLGRRNMFLWVRLCPVGIFLALFLSAQALTLTKTQVFPFDGPSRPQIQWGTNATHIDVQLTYPTRGWIAMGLSPNGAMDQSDVLFGYVDDKSGKVVLQDRFISANGYTNVNPVLDSQQDWIPVSGSQNATHTTIRALRKLQTCDRFDRPIVPGKANVLFSFNTNDPVSETGRIAKHTKRGAADFDFLATSTLPPAPPADAKVMRITMGNVSIVAGQQTQYICRYLKLPALERKYHIIMDRPVTDPRSMHLLHHVDVYLCGRKPRNLTLEPFDCGEDSGMGMPRCYPYTLLSGWAVGGQGAKYPSEAGYPIGPSSEQYVFMQAHYNNVNLTGRMDDSGMSYYMTPQLRKHDIGILSLGVVDEDHRLTIPPRQANWKFSAYCPASCTSVIPNGGITIVSGMLHMHGRGKAAVARHFRNGKELPPLLQNMNYDFNYQTINDLATPIKVLPGDLFVFECTFSSENDDSAITGGEGATEEMCQGMFNYYPNLNWTDCEASYKALPYYAAVGFLEAELRKAWNADPVSKRFPNVTRYLTNFDYVEEVVDILSTSVEPYLDDRDWSDEDVGRLRNYYDDPKNSVGYCATGMDVEYEENDDTTVPDYVDQTASAGCKSG